MIDPRATTGGTDAMDGEVGAQGGGEVAAGTAVMDSDGKRVGSVRAAYPHYLAVEDAGPPPRAFRVPRQAIAAITGGGVTLTVPTDALDPMTPSADVGEGLPSHGDEPEAER